jgi:hypothetical protein
LVTIKRLSAPWGAGLDTSDDAALDGPAFGGVAELAIAADLFPVTVKAAEGSVLGERADLAQQYRVAGQPEDVADAVALAPCHGFGPAVMAVAAHHDLDLGPAGADATDDMAQDQRHLGPVWRLAGAQDDRDGLAGRRLVDVDRQKAAAVVMCVPQRELLAAVHPVLGVIDIEQDASRHLIEAVAEQLDHRHHHAFERGRAGQVFQPADRRLRAQIGAALRQPPDRHFEGPIAAQRVAVVAVGIARRDHQRAVADHLGQPVPHPFRIARILNAGGQAFGNPKPLLDRRQQQYPGVRGQPAAVEGDMHRLARDRWQTRQHPRTLIHGGRELRCFG